MTFTPLNELIALIAVASDANNGKLELSILTQRETITLLHYLKWIRAERKLA